mgnify:FL=1
MQVQFLSRTPRKELSFDAHFGIGGFFFLRANAKAVDSNLIPPCEKAVHMGRSIPRRQEKAGFKAIHRWLLEQGSRSSADLLFIFSKTYSMYRKPEFRVFRMGVVIKRYPYGKRRESTSATSTGLIGMLTVIVITK